MEQDKNFPLNKGIAVIMGLFHIGAVLALFFTTPNRILLGFTVWAIVSSVGIGVCYHRLLTHRGYETYKWLEYLMATIAALGQQSLAIIWVALHRIHHKFTEQPGKDPHTPRDGRWWSHMDWILHPNPEFQNSVFLNKWVPDLIRQPFYRKRYIQWLPTVVLATLCLIFGGVPAVLWGVTLPVVVGWHQTWLVNSATHIWGKRRFDTPDDSRNLWWVGLLAWGEGWHNNHHYDPVRARHGIVWYEFDVNWYFIKTLQFFGLVWKVKD